MHIIWAGQRSEMLNELFRLIGGAKDFEVNVHQSANVL